VIQSQSSADLSDPIIGGPFSLDSSMTDWKATRKWGPHAISDHATPAWQGLCLRLETQYAATRSARLSWVVLHISKCGENRRKILRASYSFALMSIVLRHLYRPKVSGTLLLNQRGEISRGLYSCLLDMRLRAGGCAQPRTSFRRLWRR
jgi:hypothetical protein